MGAARPLNKWIKQYSKEGLYNFGYFRGMRTFEESFRIKFNKDYREYRENLFGGKIDQYIQAIENGDTVLDYPYDYMIIFYALDIDKNKLPLFINCKQRIVQDIVKWRLKNGK